MYLAQGTRRWQQGRPWARNGTCGNGWATEVGGRQKGIQRQVSIFLIDFNLWPFIQAKIDSICRKKTVTKPVLYSEHVQPHEQHHFYFSNTEKRNQWRENEKAEYHHWLTNSTWKAQVCSLEEGHLEIYEDIPVINVIWPTLPVAFVVVKLKSLWEAECVFAPYDGSLS